MDSLPQFHGVMSPAAARALLSVKFSEETEEKMRALLSKAKRGAQNSEEEKEMTAYEQMACLLDILHARARKVLARKKDVSG